MNLGFWKQKRVLITGHTGFKGSWLSLWLNQLGAELCGIALPPVTTPNLFELADVASCLQNNLIDICDLNLVSTIVEQFQPEIIIHMAAQPLVRYSYQNPVETYQTNVMGTVNVLQSAKNCRSVKAVVNVTTDKCYENKEWIWGYREDEPMGGYDPYSNSKGCSELITSAYRNSFFNELEIGLASARAGNVIGGGDWSQDRLLVDIITSIINKKQLIIRNPGAIRPWQHVLEPLAGYLTLAEQLYCDHIQFAQAWNFGPKLEDVANVETIVKKILSQWKNNDVKWSIQKNENQPHEANFLKLDITKATTKLNWYPKLNLDAALKWTIDWYQAWDTNSDMRQITLEQINHYQKQEL